MTDGGPAATAAASAAPPTSDDRHSLIALAAVTTVAAVVSSLGAPMVPGIAEAHDVPLSTAQWALTATLIAGAGTTPLLGRVATGSLRRPLILAGLAVVLVGTVLSALAPGLGTLTVGRALQGVGLSLVPLALAAARDTWTGADLAPRLALLSVTTVAGAGLGYPVAALVAVAAGIAGAYWFGAILVGLTLCLCVRHLPRRAVGEPQEVDLLGAAVLTAGTVAVLLAVSQGDRWGWSAPRTLALLLGGAVVLGLWICWTVLLSRRGRRPLVDLSLAFRSGVVGPNLVTFGLGLAMYGMLTLVVLLVQVDGDFGLGYGVAVAGLVLVPYSLCSVGGNRLARAVARRWGAHVLLPVGCAVFSSAMLLIALVHDHLWHALLVMALGGLGSGFTFSSLPMLIVPHVPAAETGSAMAFNQLLRYLGFSVGSVVSVALLEAYGGGQSAFRATALTLAAVCLTVGAVASVLDRPGHCEPSHS